ncbi:GNAT family N-acetyltransferase [Terriglobus tenax]|uniref:GNAT family N-acetyltransferase n=1 Tax=Terriglobus tenax TaxID=1111115 RepID=UPI0021E0AF48|nr:GNAT family N-acetyltransferase [Terriglobus tenax]
MPTVEIRPAHFPDDAEAVRTLFRAYAAFLRSNPGGGASICITGFEQELAGLPGQYAAPAGCVLLAIRDGQPIGCVGLRPITPKAPGNLDEPTRAVEMKRLWAESTARGLGLGRHLVEKAVEWAREQGYTGIYLDTVAPAMPEAYGLYQRLGFQEIPRYNNNDTGGLTFMRKDLSPQ